MKKLFFIAALCSGCIARAEEAGTRFKRVHRDCYTPYSCIIVVCDTETQKEIYTTQGQVIFTGRNCK